MNHHLFHCQKGKLMPNSFRWFVGQGLMTFTPWYFCAQLNDFDFATKAFLKEDHMERKILTVLRRQEMDDFAGFEIEKGLVQENIIYFHPAFNGRKTIIEKDNFSNLFDFVRLVVLKDMEEWALTEDFEGYKYTN